MIKKVELKQKLFRPGSIGQFPKLSKPNPDMQIFIDDMRTALESVGCGELLDKPGNDLSVN